MTTFDRKTRRRLVRVEQCAEKLANAIGDVLEPGTLRNTDMLLDGLVMSADLASALRIVLNRPATSDEARKAKWLIAREKRATTREAKRRRAA